MNKKILIILTLFFAAGIGTVIPHWITGQAQSAANEITWQFNNLGMTTTQGRKDVQGILDNIVGIEDVKFTPGKDQVIITFDRDVMQAEWIAKSLRAGGYKPGQFQQVKK